MTHVKTAVTTKDMTNVKTDQRYDQGYDRSYERNYDPRYDRCSCTLPTPVVHESQSLPDFTGSISYDIVIISDGRKFVGRSKLGRRSTTVKLTR